MSDNKEAKWKKLLKPILLVSTVALLMVLAKAFDLGEKLDLLKEWIGGLGNWGPIAFVLAYVVATAAMVPGTALTFGAGALFGPVLGVILVSIGSTIGAAVCFLIARYFARDSISKWLAGNEKFAKLDKMSVKHGVMIVAITRLVPIFPFNVLNYGFGLTGVSFGTYVLWSWVCMLPGTIFYVVGAAAITQGLASGEVPWPLVGVLAGVMVFLFFVVRFAKSKLDDDPETEEAEGHDKEAS